MPARLPALSLLLVGCASLRAAQQSPAVVAAAWPADQLAAHLASADPVAVAWAGHRVREANVREAVPAVRAALRRLAADDSARSRLARANLLDALIRFDERLTVEELLAHATGNLRGATMVLACQAPAVAERYFAARFATDGDDTEWALCGDWLAFLRNPEFVPRCVARFAFPMRITLSDGSSPDFSYG